ncbi:putative ribonuclease H-like domain-containing protein [Tanacetum coccineum]
MRPIAPSVLICTDIAKISRKQSKPDNHRHRKGIECAKAGRMLSKFKIQKVLTLVYLPSGKKAIGTKWVYRNKKDERGIVVRNKARLVAQGYKQEESIDYDEVFALVARVEEIRIFLAFASFMNFPVYQMYVKSAFLYDTIEEEVYVCQPPSFVDPEFPEKVYKVEKALYGLHQAPRAWYEKLSTYLLDNGFHRGQIDKSLFIKRLKGDILLVQVYVDDTIFSLTKKSLCDEFEQIMHNRTSMLVNLKKFGFSSVRITSTPIETNKALTKDEDGEDVDVHLYRSMIGSLMYLTSSRPDIMFSVCACSRFQVQPKVSHLNAVKRIFRYLKGQPKLGLWYPKDSPLILEAFSDSDYAGASLDRKSTTGGCQFLGSRLISWQCKKQTVVANSTTEAEYIAASHCCGQVLWIQNQMLDYGFNFMQTKIHVDNESAICVVKNPVYHSKTKHIEIRHHFIRDSYEKRLIEMAISTKWVFRNKKDERGIVVKNKARLVAQGHTQEEDIDYDEVFAPVARIEAIRLFLAYSSFKDFIVYQMDVKSAFLYEKIEKEVYVCQPPSFEDPHFPDKVYKVEKALYGLHQALRAWYETLSTYLLDNGFQGGQIDKTLFIKRHKDDILLVQFQMSSIGEFSFFLGLQVKQKSDGIFISQDKYVAKILKKFDFASIKTTNTPMETNKALVKDEEAKDVDVHLYRSMIGSLMYLTASRPDIMFAVCACARFQVTLKTSHFNAVKRIFRYLKGQPKLGLWYSRDSPFDLEAFSDSDYAGASLDRKSTTGGYQFFGKRLISWQCKKQTIVANSTTEAEYVAATNCYGQNPVFHSKTKHIEIRHHFIRASYEKKLIQVIKIYTDQNVADLLTKTLMLAGKSKEVETQRYLSLVVPLKKVGDEAVHKELGDRMERAATTASSLEAEQDSGGGPKCQDTILGDVNAQTRFETTSKQSNDPPLSKFNTFGSGEDSMQLMELMTHCIKLSALLQLNAAKLKRQLVLPVQVPAAEGDSINTLIKVLDLEKAKFDQAIEIANLKKRVDKLEKRKFRTIWLKRLKKVGATRRIESSNDSLGTQEDASKQGRRIEDIDADAEVTLVNETQERQDEDLMFDTGVLDGDEMFVDATTITTAGVEDSAALTIQVSTADKGDEGVTATKIDELTLAQTLIEKKETKPKVVITAATKKTTTRPKDRGVVVQEPSEFRTSPEAQPSKNLERNIQAQLDAEIIEEERLERQKQEVANIALIESWENTQAMMEADRLLAERL